MTTSAKDALAGVKSATSGLKNTATGLMNKKKATVTAALSTSAINDRLQAKLEDKLSSAAKSASSVNLSIPEKNLSALTANLGTAGLVSSLKSAVGKASSAVSGLITKGKDAILGDVLKSKVGGMIGGQAAAMLEGESKINAKLASTLVTTGAKDDLATVDAYDFSAKDIFTSFTGKLSSNVLGDVGDSFRAGGGLAKNMAGLLKAGVSGGLSLNKDALKDRLIGAVGGKAGLINSLSGSLKGAIGDATGIPSSILNRADVVIKGVARSIDSGDIKSASTLFNLIGDVVDDRELVDFIDIGAKTSLLTEVYRQAIQLGVPDAIDIIVDKASANDKSAVYALSNVIDDAVINGNVQTITTLLNKLGPAAVLAKFPQAIPQMLSSYQFPTAIVDGNYDAAYTELTTALARLDVNWGKYQRNGVWVTNLSVFTNISADARTLLTAKGDFQDAVRVAGNYPMVALASLGKELYPQAAL